MEDPKPSEKLHRKWKHHCDFLAENLDHLNEWEQGFIDTISIRLSREQELTFKQSAILSRIFHKVEERVG